MDFFTIANKNLRERLQDVALLLHMIENLEQEKNNRDAAKIYKGLFFVVLYGAVEKCLVDCVSIAINYLNEQDITVLEVRPELWAMAFDPDCTRIEQNSNSKKWGNRNKLFTQLQANNVLPQIQSHIFPTAVGNIKLAQIDGIWNTFGIKEPSNPEATKGYKQTLSNIADCRMQIAHGDATATEIGARYSLEMLKRKLADIDYYCNYIIACFNNYVTNKDFLSDR